MFSTREKSALWNADRLLVQEDVPDHEGDVHKPAIADILIVSASPQSAGPTGPSTNKIALQNGRWQRVAASANIGAGQ